MQNNAPDFISDEEMATHISKNAPDFISDDEMAQYNEEIKPYNPLQTYAGNALDTLTLDHAPNLISASQNLSFSSPEYIKDRDTHRERLELGKEDNPIPRYAGAITGAAVPILATLLAPEATVPAYLAGSAEATTAANVAKTAAPSIAKAVGKNLLINEAMTGLQNPGDVKGKATGLQLEDRFNNMIDPTNIALNTVTAGGAGLLENKLAKMKLNKDNLAFKTLEPGSKTNEITLSLVEDELTPDKASKIGQLIRNTGVLKDNPDIITIAKRTKSKLDDIGKKIGGILETNDSKVKYKTQRGPLESYSSEALAEILNSKFEGDGDIAKEVAGTVDKIINDRIKYKGENLSLSDLQKIRSTLQSKVNYSVLNQGAEKTKQEMLADSARYFNKMIEQEIEKNASVLGERASSELKIANQQYHLMNEAAKMAHKAASTAEKSDTAQNLIKNLFNPAGIVSGAGVGMYSHNPLAGIGTGLAVNGLGSAKNYLVPRANSMAANIADSLLPQLSKGGNVSSRMMMTPRMNQTPLVEPPPPTPQEIDSQIKNDPSMTASQKAKARNEVRKSTR